VLLISFLKRERTESDGKHRGIHYIKVNYLYKRFDLEYEGEGEEGKNPWNLAENLLKNSQKYF
jgi:hypothetical protein